MPASPLILADLQDWQVYNYENSTYLHNFIRWLILCYGTVIVATAVLYDYCEYYCNCAWGNLHDPAIQCTCSSPYLSERGV